MKTIIACLMAAAVAAAGFGATPEGRTGNPEAALKSAESAGAGAAEGPGTYFVPEKGTANVVAQTDARPGAMRKTVAFLGGSITEMDGFRPRVMKLLRTKYPSVDLVEIASGLASTCSDAAAFRLEEDVLSKGVPDLFVVEEVVNDDQDGHFSRQRCVRGMEGVVRHVLERNPSCAVVVGLMVNIGQYRQLTQGKTPPEYAAHAAVAKHYGAAVADVGSALAASARAGGLGWEQYRDCHPSPEGCDFAAKVVVEAIGRVFDPTKPAVRKNLPEPLDPASYFRGMAMPWNAISAGTGWQVSRPDWERIPGSKRGYFTLGPALWSETRNAETAFGFTGTAAGAFLTAGPDAADLEVSVDGGEWERKWLRAEYGSLHYPYVQMLADGLADGPHTVRLRVVATERNGKPAAAVRIHRLFVNGRPQ